jgi:predicted permease
MKYIWFYVLLYGSLTAGILLYRWKRYSSLIMRLAILLFDTPILIYSFWIFDSKKLTEYSLIPVMGAVLVLVPMWLASVFAKRILPEKKSQGSFILSAAFSNIGSTGGSFITYLLFGLHGLSLGYLYLLPYPLLVFTMGFSIARKYSSDERVHLKDYFLNIITNLFSLVPLLAMAAGFILNISSITPPDILVPLSDIWIKSGLGVMCFAIGMTLKLQRISSLIKPILSLCSIKFILIPCIAAAAVLLFYGSFSPLAAKIIMIQSFMPAAIYSVITANLFGLDRDLVNSLWISSTIFLIPIAGILLLLFR